MRFTSSLGRLRPLLDLIFPPRCVYCGRLGAYLCETCQAEAQRIGPDVCIRCGNPLTTRGICHRCRQDPPDPIRAIRGVFFYNGPIAQSIRGLKYHGVRALAPILAEHLVAYIQEHPIPIDGLVPVPLHPAKLAQRGFNQSELLADSITQTLGIPLRTDLLKRTRHTRPQAQLDRKQRLQNVAGAFSPCDGVSLHGETLLLIDDVATTGATLRACAQTLRQMGAGDIWALTVARANMNAARDASPSPAASAEAFLLWDAERKQPIPDPTISLI
jgi:ComF family protein